jgi:rhodanese-related sulfurtransferase
MDIPRMGKDEVRSRLNDPELLVIDVRQEQKDSKIEGATLQRPGEVDSWAEKYPKDKTLVLYCA